MGRRTERVHMSVPLVPVPPPRIDLLPSACASPKASLWPVSGNTLARVWPHRAKRPNPEQQYKEKWKK
ncbi:unnamed protein product [Boreogadus saida]